MNWEWLSKHADTIVVLSTLIGSFLWMNAQFNNFDRRFAEIEKDMAILKTVMIMKNIMPTEFAVKGE